MLIGIGFLAGVVTSVSPCVLPVLPILLAGGATGTSPRRPFAIVAGLVASFTVFTLLASRLLHALGLPQDVLRDVAIALLLVLAATLLVPRFAHLLERPFYALTRRSGGDLGGGFVLGASLGLVFVPCAGPVLAAITVVAANEDLGARAFAVTIAYAVGAAVPMLAIALGGLRVAQRTRAAGPMLRRAMGVVIALTALGIAFDLDRHFTTALPGYTQRLQDRLERSDSARRELAKLTGAERAAFKEGGGDLADYGVAPDFRQISHWLNTPGDRPLTMRGLRGKVVLIDFWTYSCINCLRTLPHLRAWNERYAKDGLVIVGVHSPEFAFEHSLANVRSAVKRLDVRWPVALDNGFGTWSSWANQYWPAEYLIDRRGHVRRAHFGEGKYDESEQAIRTLLLERPGTTLDAPPTAVPDTTPRTPLTPESYLGYERIDRVAGLPVRAGVPSDYVLPRALEQNFLGFGGSWTIEDQRAVAGKNARLRLHFYAKKVFLVMSGTGRVHVLVDGRSLRTVQVRGDRLYTLVDSPHLLDALLELRFTPGVSAYAFTFG